MSPTTRARQPCDIWERLVMRHYGFPSELGSTTPWHGVRGGRGFTPPGPWRVLSQITGNRKVETRKPLIFQHVIFSFGLKNATLRQNHGETMEYVAEEP